MNGDQTKLSGSDLEQGVELSKIPDNGMLLGHTRREPVMLVRRGHELFAIGAICTHYGAPLEQGLLVGDTVRCPWHHDGDPDARDCSITYRRDGKKLAEAMIHRDLEGLRVEVEFERAMASERKEIFPLGDAQTSAERAFAPAH